MKSNYKHGIATRRVPTQLSIPIKADGCLQCVIGTAPVNMAEDPYDTVNKPFSFYNKSAAIAALGYSTDFENYTLCQSMYASFDVFGVAPVIIKTKPARDGLKAQKTEKARKSYREQHESEFIISESAARYFKAQGISKLPASKALQTEIEQLTKEKNALYNEYREKKASVRELQTVKSNLDKILRREPERGKGRENER